MQPARILSLSVAPPRPGAATACMKSWLTGAPGARLTGGSFARAAEGAAAVGGGAAADAMALRARQSSSMTR